jgi:hypothetical protein
MQRQLQTLRDDEEKAKTLPKKSAHDDVLERENI